jgi:nitrogen fixation protein FixH
MTNPAPTLEQKEKTAQLVWTGFILSFFLIQAVIWTVAFSVTANDQSHAVVAGYDEKALLWDEEKARRTASAQLGWQSELVVNPASDIRGFREVTFILHNANNSPITDATVELTAFHRGRAAQRQLVRFSELSDGVYAGQVQIRKTGLWQFDGVARKGDEAFIISQRQSIKAVN